MAYQSCILKSTNTRYSILREDFIQFCDDNRCAALLLSFFEYHHNILLTRFKNKQELYAEMNKELPFVESFLYQSHSLKSLELGIIGQYKRDAISEAITLLSGKKALQIMEQPAHIRNKPRKFLLRPEIINQYITQELLVVEKSTANNPNVSASADTGQLVVEKSTAKETIKDLESSSIKDIEKDSGACAPRVSLLKRKVQEPEVNKPTLLKRKVVYPEVDIFRHWNSLGSPLKSHREDVQTKTFHKALEAIVKALKKHSMEEIMNSMSKYHRLVNYPNSKLNHKAPGHLVSLVEFFEFSKFTADRIVVNTMNQKEDPIQDVDSWFEECLNSWEYLTTKFDKPPKCINDDNPAVTKELARVYREQVNSNPLSANEINVLIRAAAKLVSYHENMKGKLSFTSCPLEKNSVKLFAHHMIDSILERTPDKTMVAVSWLLTDNHFNVRMAEHFKRLGMLDRDYQGSKVDLMTEDLKAQKEKEIADTRKWFRDELTKLNVAEVPDNDDRRKKLNEDMTAKLKDINAKYAGEVKTTAAIDD